ncbi:hypothetical protein JL722_6256 [Aureococcus anophagefferens]|nr:hypothetical protein JL722_6256 [Aureococcus anophagefferens]
MLEDLGNLKEAFRYFHLSADQGCTEAEFNLGVCYWEGDGVEIDVEAAEHWFTRAAAKGDEQAKDRLVDVYRLLEECRDDDST